MLHRTNRLILFLFLLAGSPASGQDSLPPFSSPHIPPYLQSVSSKAARVDQKLDKTTQRFLLKMQREEEKLKKKLAKKDSLAAARLFPGIEKKYAALRQQFLRPVPEGSQSGLGYAPYLDTLKTTLRFLKVQEEKLAAKPAGLQDKLMDATDRVSRLDAKLGQAQSIRQFLKERRQYLKEQLSPFGLAGQMKKMNRQVFYYSQAIKEYEQILKDPKKIEARAMVLLRKTPAFRKFMQQHSQFASLFGMPSAPAGPVSFAGLQSRASVQQLIQSSVPGGANPQQFLGRQLQAASQQLSQQKQSVRLPGLQENMGETPGFKPNRQKHKPFFRRLEYGANIQFGKVNRFLPAASELAVSLGYRVNDDGVIGIASSYRLGLGSGLTGLRFTHQGFGMRSYIDWQILGGFYVSGGFEKNFLPQLDNIVPVQRPELWQESGLVGLGKKYSVGKKRKGSVQVLFDFLSYRNIPRSQPVIFRTGIHF